MASRIDQIEVVLSVYDEFEGHRSIRFAVRDDPPFLAECYRVWKEYSERLVIEARERGGDWSMLG